MCAFFQRSWRFNYLRFLSARPLLYVCRDNYLKFWWIFQIKKTLPDLKQLSPSSISHCFTVNVEFFHWNIIYYRSYKINCFFSRTRRIKAKDIHNWLVEFLRLYQIQQSIKNGMGQTMNHLIEWTHPFISKKEEKKRNTYIYI